MKENKQIPRNITAALLIVFLVFASLVANSQKKDDLENQRRKMLADIEYANKLLKKNSKEKKANINQLLILKNSIKSRKNLILSYSTEIKIISNEISDKEEEIENIETEIKLIKEEYSKLIYSAYKNRHSYDTWMFIFSSKDFNQAYRRLKYLQQFSDYRKKQVELIIEREEDLKRQIEELNIEKAKKEELIEKEKAEQEKLTAEKEKVSGYISSLKKKDRELRKEIKKRKREAKQIKKAIDRIIAEENRRREEALKKNKPVGKFALTPEESLISENFGLNKGKFPWPTVRGVVTETYGEHNHPVLAGIKTFNNGINISTEEGAEVRAIFDGEVRDVWSIQGRNMAVIIKHGEFFSVYQNLSNVKVKPGDKVSRKQVIGVVFTDNNDGKKTVLHLEIWKGSSRLDPSLWLARK